jgi:hypothetical protein
MNEALTGLTGVGGVAIGLLGLVMAFWRQRRDRRDAAAAARIAAYQNFLVAVSRARLFFDIDSARRDLRRRRGRWSLPFDALENRLVPVVEAAITVSLLWDEELTMAAEELSEAVGKYGSLILDGRLSHNSPDHRSAVEGLNSATVHFRREAQREGLKVRPTTLAHRWLVKPTARRVSNLS